MDSQQFQLFLEDNRKSTADAIAVTVNGKIDTLKSMIISHNDAHEKDMKRMMPIIEAYEEAERRVEDAKRGGKAILWTATFITAVGGAWLVLRGVFFR